MKNIILNLIKLIFSLKKTKVLGTMLFTSFFLMFCGNPEYKFDNEDIVNVFYGNRIQLLNGLTIDKHQENFRLQIMNNLKSFHKIDKIKAIAERKLRDSISGENFYEVVVLISNKGQFFTRTYSKEISDDPIEIKSAKPLGIYKGCNQKSVFYCLNNLNREDYRFLYIAENDIYYSEFIHNCEECYYEEIDKNCSDEMILETVKKLQSYFLKVSED